MKPSRWRQLLFAVLPALLLLAVLEVISLAYYFQQRGDEVFALTAALSDLRRKIVEGTARETVRALDLPPVEEIYADLYGPGGEKLLADFKRRYREDFSALARAVADADARFVVLYLPPTRGGEVARRVDRHDRAFYRRLAERHGALFVDLSEAFAMHPRERLALLPQNFHLGRFGNQVLSEELAKHLKPITHRSAIQHSQRPDLLGDLPPSIAEIWPDDLMPYRVTTNRQGLRATADLVFPKRRQRILLLGDSFTFGINQHDLHTYPAYLQKALPGREIINAGMPGYTAWQESELFVERARFVEPDVVVLQVLFNDLYGYFFFERELFARATWQETWAFGRRQGRRASRAAEPTELEVSFLRQLGVEVERLDASR